MRSGMWWAIVVIGFAGAVVSAVMVVAVEGWLDPADKVSSVVGGFVGIASLTIAILALRAATGSGVMDPVDQLNQAVEELAQSVDRQWTREAAIRGLLHPQPLRVTWLSTERPVGPPAAEILGTIPGVKPKRLRLAGDVRNAADTWEQLPSRQLVAIGAPGAGKTSFAMLLVRQLLERRESGRAVPVLLNLVGWDPTCTHFDTWLTQRIAADYPQLTTKRKFGAAAARRMVDRRLVVPILDGLDEMPEPARPLAIAALTAAIRSERPLVLTCRADEYEAATKLAGAPLAQAAVVELEPVSPAEIITYLTVGHIDGDQRWDKVSEHLRKNPGGALATALSTPLMAYLARIAYHAPGADPDPLLQVLDTAEVEDQLLAAYLPTMYSSNPVEPGGAKLRNYKTGQANRWLGALALQMNRRGDRHLRLWSLRSIRGLSPMKAIRVTVIVVLSTTWAFFSIGSSTATLFGSILHTSAPFVFMPVFSFLSVFLFSLATSKLRATPYRVEMRPFGMIGGGLSGLAGMLLVVVIVAIIQVVRVENGIGSYVDAASFLGELVSTPLLWMGIMVGSISGLLVNPASKTEASDPLKALTQDSSAFLLVVFISMLALGVAVTIFEGILWFAILAASFASFPFGLLISMTRGVGVASARWFVVRMILFLAGVLPFLAANFIKDAHRRGVLRVVGMEYQFRHVKIQAYLAVSRRSAMK